MAKDLAEAAFSKSVAPLFHDFFAFVGQGRGAVVRPVLADRLPPSNVRADVYRWDGFFARSRRRRIDGMEEFVSARRRDSRVGCEESCHTAVCRCTHFWSILIARAAEAGLMSTNNCALAYQRHL